MLSKYNYNISNIIIINEEWIQKGSFKALNMMQFGGKIYRKISIQYGCLCYEVNLWYLTSFIDYLITKKRIRILLIG